MIEYINHMVSTFLSSFFTRKAVFRFLKNPAGHFLKKRPLCGSVLDAENTPGVIRFRKTQNRLDGNLEGSPAIWGYFASLTTVILKTTDKKEQ